MEIPISQISPNPQQPRTDFDPAALAELAASIREHGVILPVALEKRDDGPGLDGEPRYYLEDGERRLRAAQLAGLTTIPAVVNPSRNGTGARLRLERALVANLQRQDMNPIETARAYAQLQEFGLTNVQISHQIGKGAKGIPHVNAHLQLLRLDPEIQTLIAQGFPHNPALTRALLSIPDPPARIRLARSLYERKSTAQAAIRAALRLADALLGNPLSSEPETRPQNPAPNPPPAGTAHSPPSTAPSSPPALTLAKKRTGRPSPEDDHKTKQRYDALVHTGHLPMWPAFKTAVAAACRKCAWHDAANEKICGDCPVVHVVQNILHLQKSSRSLRPSHSL